MSLTFNSFIKVGIIANYYANIEYYTNVLCENKSQPILSCKGKCKLNKELIKVENNSFDNDNNKKNYPLEILKKNSLSEYVVFECRKISFNYIDIIETVKNGIYKNIPSELVQFDIFHPPSFYC